MARPTGAMNKNKSFLLKRLQDMYGDDFHPIMKMAENAVMLQKEAEKEPDVNTLKAAIDGWDKVAQYTEPKLKSTEVNVTGELNTNTDATQIPQADWDTLRKARDAIQH